MFGITQHGFAPRFGYAHFKHLAIGCSHAPQALWERSWTRAPAAGNSSPRRGYALPLDTRKATGELLLTPTLELRRPRQVPALLAVSLAGRTRAPPPAPPVPPAPPSASPPGRARPLRRTLSPREGVLRATHRRGHTHVSPTGERRAAETALSVPQGRVRAVSPSPRTRLAAPSNAPQSFRYKMSLKWV